MGNVRRVVAASSTPVTCTSSLFFSLLLCKPMASFVQWGNQASRTISLSCQSDKAKNKLFWMSLTYALGHLVSQPFVCKAFEFFLGVTLCCSPRQGTGGVLWQDWWSARGRSGWAPAVCGGGRQNSDQEDTKAIKWDTARASPGSFTSLVAAAALQYVLTSQIHACDIPWMCVYGFEHSSQR